MAWQLAAGPQPGRNARCATRRRAAGSHLVSASSIGSAPMRIWQLIRFVGAYAVLGRAARSPSAWRPHAAAGRRADRARQPRSGCRSASGSALRPQAAEIVQPIAQFLAAFPANLLFPVAVSLIVRFELNPEIWLSPLMILGTQWYILFNVIAGASAIPRDLRDAGENFGVRGWLWWRRRAARGVSLLRHRRDHRLRRLLECQHRRRGRQLGQRPAASPWPGRLYRQQTEPATSIASCSASP